MYLETDKARVYGDSDRLKNKIKKSLKKVLTSRDKSDSIYLADAETSR